jgi:predicted unusual protein kinase regulating ubiquinone biosynthesis (AarF/ABC1/UbiB family)
VSEIPEGALTRTARLAGLPLSAAGRLTLGWGQRLIGRDRTEVSAQMQRRTAEQLFEVLGTLKGGAMKFGQALSVYEAAIPEEFAAPYREALTKLQNAAPPMPTTTVYRVLDEQLGTSWREHFASFEDQSAAAASIGQVHRGVWHDGRAVAVKIQYPGAGAALRADLDQLARIAPLLGLLIPGVEVRPLIAELRERVMEELDYTLEADNQRAFAREFADDPHLLVPRVVASAPKVMVSEWVDGVGLAEVIRAGTREQRDRAGELLAELHFSAPQRVGLLHADPHPGNYKLTGDDRLAVVDFGSVARLPGGSPPIIGRVSRLALDGDASAVLDELRAAGFVTDRFEPDPDALIDYVAPFAEPLRHSTFHFTRQWMQDQAAKMADLSSAESKLARHLNLPPAYLMIHRVTFGSLGVLCQLDATAPLRSIVQRWQPGFADPTD